MASTSGYLLGRPNAAAEALAYVRTYDVPQYRCVQPKIDMELLSTALNSPYKTYKEVPLDQLVQIAALCDLITLHKDFSPKNGCESLTVPVFGDVDLADFNDLHAHIYQRRVADGTIRHMPLADAIKEKTIKGITLLTDNNRGDGRSMDQLPECPRDDMGRMYCRFDGSEYGVYLVWYFTKTDCSFTIEPYLSDGNGNFLQNLDIFRHGFYCRDYYGGSIGLVDELIRMRDLAVNRFRD